MGAWSERTWDLLLATAPALMAGFLVAGLLLLWVPRLFVKRKLGGSGMGPVVRAGIVGVPLPLCSCSVVPAAGALREAGASRGATLSFLVSTPETGVDSFAVSWALLDPVAAVFRPLAALVTAVVTGGVAQAAHPEDPVEEAEEDALSWLCRICPPGTVREPGHDHGLGERVRAVARHAFVDLFDDIVPWLLGGLAVAGLITGEEASAWISERMPTGVGAYLAALALGLPVYVCASASTPLALGLLAAGLSPGAAFVFLLAGPATNAATVLAVRGMLGGRALGIYLASIAGVSVAAGFGLDALYGALGGPHWALPSSPGTEASHGGPLAWACAALLLIGCAGTLKRRLVGGGSDHVDHGHGR